MEIELGDSEPIEPVLKAIRTLRKNHPLRQQAMAVLADSQANIEDLKPILRTLTSASGFRKNERVVASWLIAHCKLVRRTTPYALGIPLQGSR